MLTEAKNQFKVILLSIKYNVMREMINSVSFVLKVVMMMLNNASFIVQWIVLFSLKDSFGGFELRHVMLLWGISSTAYGISHLCFDGVGYIPTYIENGQLDTFLVQPKNTLLMTAVSKSAISAIGDLLYGIIITLIFWHRPSEILLYVLFSVLASLIYTAYRVVLSSFTFWFIKSGDAFENLRGLFINFSIYPQNIFGNAIKIIMFTVVPAGIAIYLPVVTIMSFNIVYLFAVLLFTAFSIFIAFFMFNRGLKRYESTNLMVART